MKYNPDIHHRRSIRLKGYDYSSDGKYFVTICTQDRAMLFGEVVVGADLVSAQMALYDAGKMIETLFLETIGMFQGVSSQKHIVMPNHFHCIMSIDRAHAQSRADTRSAPTVSAVVQAFKSRTTIEYLSGVKSGIYMLFNKRVWQRNYYEHIIRDELEYQKIWQYIDTNPAKWEEDCYFTQ